MRLINTSTLALHSFSGDTMPDYAILSHRWNEEEVSFQDLQNGKGKIMPGYSKIQRCCAQAQLDGWQYAWIDSCCIDKTSSAELSEAINSIFQWYNGSQVCYAYLADVRQGEKLYSDLRKSNWFTRGWTLQALLAPSLVGFFDHDWNDIGTKGSLEELISEITGIDNFINFEKACVAQKMSWAAKRITTRVEDMAYCLLGLFDVNMPPLYGEGEKAFMRLQLEILKTSDDESIFAWYEIEQTDDNGLRYGLLASSPKQFKYSGCIRPVKIKDHANGPLKWEDRPFSMTNKGLYISLHLIPETTFGPFEEARFIVPLKCSWAGGKGGWDSCPVIRLERNVVDHIERYGRAPITGIDANEKVVLLNDKGIRHQIQISKGSAQKYIYVKEFRFRHNWPSTLQRWEFAINASLLKGHGFVASQYAPMDFLCTWGDSAQDEISLVIRSVPGTVAGVLFTNTKTRESIVLAIIVHKIHPPCLLLFKPNDNQGLDEITGSLYELYFGAASGEIAADSNISNSPANPLDIAATIGPMGSVASSEAEYHINELSPIPKKRPPLDRMSRQLKNGKSVSASLRHITAGSGGGRFLINIEINSGGGLRWPPPAWVDMWLVSISMKDMEIKEQEKRTGTSKRTKKNHRRTAPPASSEQTDRERRKEEGESVERVNRLRNMELSRSERMRERHREPVPWREESRGYRRPRSRDYSQDNERERSRNRRPHDSSWLPSRSERRDEREWIRNIRERSDRRDV